jgi:hypothetical protein
MDAHEEDRGQAVAGERDRDAVGRLIAPSATITSVSSRLA